MDKLQPLEYVPYPPDIGTIWKQGYSVGSEYPTGPAVPVRTPIIPCSRSCGRYASDPHRHAFGGVIEDLAQVLKDQREALRTFEGTALAGIAETLAHAATMIVGVVERIEASSPQDWLPPEEAARYVGYRWEGVRQKSSAIDAFLRLAAQEGIPVHRLSAQKRLYNRRELDDWLSRR